MFERFTDRARRVVVLAQQEARIANWPAIYPVHILLGIIHEGESTAWQALCDTQPTGPEVVDHPITLEAVRRCTGEGGTHSPAGHIPFTTECKKALELGLREALQLGHNYVGCEHLLLGLVREGDIVPILEALGTSARDVRERVLKLLTQQLQPETHDTSALSYTVDVATTPRDELRAAARAVVDHYWRVGCGDTTAATLLKRLMLAIETVT